MICHNYNMNKITKKHILNILIAHKNDFSSAGLSRIGLFGSYVRNEESQTSDIDLILEFHEDQKTYRNFIKSIDIAEKVLGIHVDVVTKEGLSPYIGPLILKEAEYVQIS